MSDMIMNDMIMKRKSVRKYDPAPLGGATLEKIQAQIKNLKPLYPDIKYSIDIVNKTKGIFNVKAPDYIIFGSEEKDGAYENIGFIGQQLSLYLSGIGIGSCWLGAAKPTANENTALPFVICMSFGIPEEPIYRSIDGFKRKPLTEISEGTDERLEAARLAPSAVNAQNWYFSAGEGKIHCYRKKANPILGFIYNKLHAIDMGIALCHIAMESDDFNFGKEPDVPEHSGCVYVGTVR